MFRTGVALALLTLAAPVLAAPPTPRKPDPDPKSLAVPGDQLSKARDLVQKLGSEVFADREDAERTLAAMGRLARPALLDGVSTDPDPEIRSRCRGLLPKAEAEEMTARLAAFTADTEGKYEHDLPGWHKLRATVRGEWALLGTTFVARPGAERAARALYIEFVTASGGRRLLNALDGPPGDLGQLVAARKTELYQMKYPRVSGMVSRTPSVAEVAVAVFAESQVNSRSVPRTTAITGVLTTSGLATVVQGDDDRAVAMRAVMTAWFDSRVDSVDMYSALTLANNMKLDDAAGRLAGRMLGTAGVQAYYKSLALTTLVRLKRADLLPDIEKAFTDTGALSVSTQIVNGETVRRTIEVRDAALAAALVLTNQNPNDYGFDSFPQNPGPTFTYTWARISDEKRKAAFEKWKAWREKAP